MLFIRWKSDHSICKTTESWRL